MPPVFGLDSALIALPPFTSFLGCRSRIMASLISFLSRRQTDRTTLTFGSCVLLLKQRLAFYFVATFLPTSPGKSKLKNYRGRISQVLWNAGIRFKIFLLSLAITCCFSD